MNYIKRDMEKAVTEASREYSCILVTGPRQVGKSTMLEHLDPARNSVTLDDYSERQLASTDPEMFLKLHQPPVLIDEVQYAPQLFSYIKIAIDRGAAPGSFWLTGSQSFSLMRLAQESLAGRIAVFSLGALSQHELYGSGELTPFDASLDSLRQRIQRNDVATVEQVYQRIWEGGLPALNSGKFTNRDMYYSGYLQTYLTRDVKDELALKDDFKFADFIRAAACRTGQQLNVHAIACDVEVSDDTAKRWLAVLEKSNVVFFLHPYSNNLLKRTVKLPKMYFFDTGLVCALTKHQTPQVLQNGALNGAILENFVVAEIRKSFLNCGIEPSLYYYRNKDGAEIDLIAEYNGVLHPIEIKKSSDPSLSVAKNFKLIASAQNAGCGAVLCFKNTLTALNSDVFVAPIWCI